MTTSRWRAKRDGEAQASGETGRLTAKLPDAAALGSGQPIERNERSEDEIERLRAALRASEAAAAERIGQLEGILEAAGDGVVLYDAAGGLARWNTAVAELFEFDQAPDYPGLPVETRPARLRIRDEHGQPLAAGQLPFMRAARGETLTGTAAMDLIVTTPSGQEKHVNASATPLRDGDGQIIGAVTVYRDVTARRALERRTRAGLDALLAMAEALMLDPSSGGPPDLARQDPTGPTGPADHPDASETIQRLIELTQYMMAGAYTTALVVEPETGRMRTLGVVGLTPEVERRWREALARQTIYDFAPPDLLARIYAEETATLDLAAEPPVPGQDYFGVQTLLFSPLRLESGDYLVVNVETRDRAGFTAQEMELAQAVARLLALTLEREGLRRERAAASARALAVSQTNERMRTFVGIAGHELRTPVTSLRASVQLAERALRASLTADLPKGVDAKLRRAHGLLEGADRQTLRLNRLIEDMLDMTRIASGKLDLRLAEDDLGDLVREVVEAQRLAWPSRAITFDLLDLPDAPLTSLMDADRVSQVVTNYLTNALKYSANDQPVAVTVTQESAGDGAIARVAIRDQGPGLAPEAQARLWVPFHQVEGIRQVSGSGVGLGLGLYISKTIIEGHSGQVGVESAPGEGSVFWFTLPLT